MTNSDDEADPQEEGLPEPNDGGEAYLALASCAEYRTEELSKMFAPVIQITDAYGSLISRLVWDLSELPPANQQERTVRDLLADTFDFLLAWRRAVLEGQLVVAYPLARRAYESLSLLVVCAQDAAIAQSWYKGKQIGNAAIRKALASLPMAESEDALKELYGFFSMGAHPNRGLVPMRLLGEGNGYVLGSVGNPNLVLVADHFIKLLNMWFWFGAAMGYHFRHVTDAKSRDWGQDYMGTADRARYVAVALTDVYNELLGQVKASGETEPPIPGHASESS
jgi:hypothetical protein